MHNDAKLGLLAGVTGVVAAAVLSVQAPQPAPPPASAPTARADAPGVVPQAVAARTAEPAPAAGKPEVEARPVSRTAGEDE